MHLRWLLAPIAGAAMALALPPWHILPGILAIAYLDHLLGRAAGWRGRFAAVWLFAFGFFLLGLYWIAIAFHAEAERFGALAIPGVLALAAILASINALAITCSLGLLRRPCWQPAVLAMAWVLGELLRGPWGTQFPWNPVASIWVVSDATMQPVAWIGTHALGFLTLLAAILLMRALFQKRFLAAGLVAACVAALALLGAWRLPALAPVEADRPLVRLVQANIAQHHKWDPDQRRAWFFRHVELSDPGSTPLPDVTIWPESSVPYSIDEQAEVRDYMTRYLGPGGLLIAGSDFVDRSREPILLHNSVYVLDAHAEIVRRYDKVQLVPFGEFLPFRRLLAPVGLEALAVGSVDFTPGAGRQGLDLPGLPPVAPLVCYEAVFAGMAIPFGPSVNRPEWLLNLTNDAWFGDSAGPYQHLAMARLRAVETGLPLVRGANTGISVVTDAYGRVLARLDLGQAGTLQEHLPPPLATAPPIGRIPHLGVLIFVALALLALPASAASMVLVRSRAEPGA